MKKLTYFRLFLATIYFSTIAGYAQVDESLFADFEYRNFGVHRVGAWVSDIAVPETDDPEYMYTFYIAARHGGVWKTINNGVTFEPVFDQYGTNSIGAIEVAPSNPEVIWVGTGEASNARSTHAGNGIYKSTDGGDSFEFMGLEDSHHIPRIIIHPENENIVYVAVMGHLFSSNEERGVFKTTDGGSTWEKVLYVNESIGAIDLVINRDEPEILYAATYDKVRLPWHYEAGGPESAIYKTTDAGASWQRLGGGLPDGNVGRIGIDVYRSNPDILYAVIENLNPKPDYVPEEQEGFDPNRDPYFDRLIGGECYRSADAGYTWTKMNHDTVNVSSKAAYSFNQIMIDPNDDNNLFINNVYLEASLDGGRTWHDEDGRPTPLFRNMFGDIRSFWIDPKDSRHLIVGSDGGVYLTYDGGKNMYHCYHIPLGEIYNVEVDDAEPYNLYAGLQDHEGWRAPSNGYIGGIGPEDWTLVGMWDGMYLKVDHTDNRWFYYTTQFGAHHRVDQLTGERVNIMPAADKGKPMYRYTWNTPLEISPHNSRIIYTGGQMLLRSLDQGDHWEELSPDLTNDDSVKIAGRGHIMYCAITTISESRVKAGVLWVGTDDGHVYLTANHGKTWTEMTDKLVQLGAPADRWVSRITTSLHDAGTAYVVKSGFRNDDFNPHVFKTTDYGETWTDISSNLPDQHVNDIIEDKTRRDLLFLGNDLGVYLSLNGGEKWIPFSNNIPPVHVKDLVIQEREKDLVVGTYGRGVYVTDIYPLTQLSDEILEKEFHLFDIESKPQKNYSEQRSWGNQRLMGDSQIYTPNEPNGLVIYYYIKSGVKKSSLHIKNHSGGLEKSIECKNEPGIHKAIWNTHESNPGTYFVTLEAGKEESTKPGVVKERWLWPVGNKMK